MEMSFLELGIDSLVGLELRNRLHKITGLTLPTTLIFDHPTPAALVGYVEARLGESGANRSARQPELATSVDANGAAPPPAHGAANTLPALFRRAHRLGKLADGILLAEAASRLRARFGLSHAEVLAPAVSPLSSGPDEPLMFCFPSVVATGGPHEFTRFARSFANRRDVVAVPNPGYLPDEPLPSTIEAVAAAQAVAVERHANGRPTVLVGFSTGGLLAYATAAQCARDGLEPAAVVLIDSYTADTMSAQLEPVIDRMLETGRAHPQITDETLTAMAAYMQMLGDWRPPEPVAATLVLAAADADARVDGGTHAGATWPHYDARIEVPANHLTILEDHADAVSRAIEEWLSTLTHAPKRGRLAKLLRQP
jgi:thioesterase domain-containing protein